MRLSLLPVLALLLSACAGAPPKLAAPTPVSLLLEAARARTDPGWSAFLSAHGHRPDVPAPAGLRQLLLGRKVLRLQLGVAYKHEANRDSVAWSLGEVGFEGSPDEVRTYLRETFAILGFQAADAEEGMVFTSTRGPLLQWVEIEGPQPWTGGRACGIGLYWSVDRAGRFPAQSLGDAIAAWPSLRDDRVDPALLKALSAWPVAAASLGGSQPRYYTWEVTLAPRPGEAGPALRERLRSLLIEADFGSDRRERDRERFWRERTGSRAALHDPDPFGAVRLSYQAEP